MFKFKKNDTAYLIVKHRFKHTEYVKCKILWGKNSAKWDKDYEKHKPIIPTNKYHKYVIETDQSETSIYSRNNKNQYVEYDENQLLTINEYRAVKLKRLSGENYLNFSPKKFFDFNYLTSFLKK